uniref:Uncharacterized protein n=1 Tax=Anguilla anguilla TaxID=7936 RepID=A0A0E9SHZ5_ANGAN
MASQLILIDIIISDSTSHISYMFQYFYVYFVF